MTRINCIPPSELVDKHLLAEYRELPRIASLARAKFQVNPDLQVSPHYVLGKGHVLFFFNKGKYLRDRFESLVAEMQSRGFKPNFTSYPDIHPNAWMGDWQPDEQAIELNKARINLRLQEMRARSAK